MPAKHAGAGWRAAALAAAAGLLALAGCAYDAPYDDYPSGYYNYPPGYYGAYPRAYYYGGYPGGYYWWDRDHHRNDHHHDHDGDHDGDHNGGGNNGGNNGGGNAGGPPPGGGPTPPHRFPPAPGHADNGSVAPPPVMPQPPSFVRRDRVRAPAQSSPAPVPPPPFKR